MAMQHFGHHADEHKASFGASDDSKTADRSLGHDHCHLSGFLGVLMSTFVPLAYESTQPKPDDDGGDYPPLFAPPPERPQWFIPA